MTVELDAFNLHLANKHKSDFSITTDPSKMDVDVIYSQLVNAYWAKGIPRSVVEKSIEHSLCFAVLDSSDTLVGFARVISDRATFAYLGDVFVVEAYRGQGLSKMLMQAVIEHPDLQGLRRMLLATADAHGLYKQFGFKPLAIPEIMMERWQADIYQA